MDKKKTSFSDYFGFDLVDNKGANVHAPLLPIHVIITYLENLSDFTLWKNISRI